MADIEIRINKKVVPLSHQNMVRVINSFLPYLTNDDLDDMMETFTKLKEHRKVKEAEAIVEMEKHSHPYPDTILVEKTDHLCGWLGWCQGEGCLGVF